MSSNPLPYLLRVEIVYNSFMDYIYTFTGTGFFAAFIGLLIWSYQKVKRKNRL